LLSGLIREGLRRGVLFVGAAPPDTEEGREALLHEPGVIEVASAEGQPAQASALYAPGREILTLLPGGHYDFASGDSIATAQVSGVLALLLAKKVGLSGADAYRLLRDTSVRTTGAGGDGALVDACAAMVALVGQGTCNPRIDTAHDPADPPAQRIALH
jgi:subtilisin family serine protease